MAKKKWLILPALFLVIQLFRPERANPGTPPELSLADAGAGAGAPPAEVRQLLRSACLNCHSNQTVWPWYSTVAPFSWLIADDVKRGRRDLNFSEWNRYDPDKKSHLLEEMTEILREGEMPPWSYRLVHSEARLSQSEVATVTKWAEQERRKLTGKQESATR